MMVHGQSSKLSRVVPKYWPHGLFPAVILRLNQELTSVKRKAEVSPIPYVVSEKLTAQTAACLAEGLIPAVSCHLKTGPVCISALEQSNLNRMITLENLIFLYFFPIQSLTQWPDGEVWYLDQNHGCWRARVSCSRLQKHYSKRTSCRHDMLCLLRPYRGLHCFCFTRIHNSYLFIVMGTDNRHWSIMTPLIDSRMTSCNVTFLRE